MFKIVKWKKKNKNKSYTITATKLMIRAGKETEEWK